MIRCSPTKTLSQITVLVNPILSASERRMMLADRHHHCVIAAQSESCATSNFYQTKGEFAMARAVARHILVATESAALKIKSEIDGGADFAALAKSHSTCPSGKSGGTLGEFEPGAMVPEFDRVVFGPLAVGAVSDPVKTQFGFHLIQVQARTS